MIACAVNTVPRKTATVLTLLGLEIQEVVRTLPVPDGLPAGSSEYDVLTAKLKAYYQPRVNVTYERAVLHELVRKEGESFEAFVTRLRLQADRCQFEQDVLDQTVLQCAVAHARSQELQRKFFDRPDLTLTQALEIARHFESTRSQLEELNRPVATVQRVDMSCFRCLSKNHSAAVCPFRQQECYGCHRVGHTQAACRQQSRPVQPSARRGPAQARTPAPATSPRHATPHRSPASAQPASQPCTRCLSRNHGQNMCPFRDQICYRCQKTGHTRAACQSRPAPSGPRPVQSPPSVGQPHQRRAHYVSGPSHPVAEESADLLFTVRQANSVQPVRVELSLDGKPVTMEVDTGASCSMMSRVTFERVFCRSAESLEPYSRTLYTYTNEKVPVLGVAQVEVVYHRQSASVPLVVVEGEGPALMGRDWLTQIRLDWSALFSAHVEYVAAPDLMTELQKLISAYPELFSPGLGKYVPRQVSLQVDDSKPRFFKHRPPPLALKQQIEEELDRQVALGILEPVTTSRWAAPVVPIKKRDGSIRLCGSYDLTINAASDLEKYPLPRVEELFATLSGGQRFTKIDLREAYLQLELDESSREYTTINTHKGLFRATRLAFGIKSAVAVFQREMETLLAGVPNTAIYLDDLCVTGRTPAEHLANVREVLRRLSAAGLKVNREKTVWLADEVQYLGHRITAAGIQPSEEKVRAILEAREPTSLQELRAYLGLVQYYSRFLPHLSSVAAPMYELERKCVDWMWGERQRLSFQKTKDLLAAAPVLVHYQQDQPLILTADASPYGVAAVLSHPDPKTGADRPVAFASRSLTTAERNYSQLDREALAIIFGVSKYHQFVYGRKFIVKSDHKPLLGLLTPGRCLPNVVSPRLMRWKLTLTAYDFELQFVPGREIANADGLSRLPLADTSGEFPVPADVVNLMEEVSHLVTAQQLAVATRRDPVLSAVYRYVQSGWPESVSDVELSHYFRRRNELSLEGGCVLWGCRVVVPPQLRSRLMLMLHDGHPGITVMKRVARGCVWWPGLDNEIEQLVQSCQSCQTHRTAPTVPANPWLFPDKPWQRLHIDYAGPVEGGHWLLVIVDSYSKWLEVHVTTSTSAAVTVDRLRQTFATHGLPLVVVSDNATAFTSMEFGTFLKGNGIKHMLSPPRHPASNGQAEALVKVVKNAIRNRTGSLQTRLCRFLLAYRSTPHSTTGRTPAELLFGRPLRTRLDVCKPSLQHSVELKQHAWQAVRNRTSQDRLFVNGDPVYVCLLPGPGASWEPGMIVAADGQACTVQLTDGRSFTRHRDHIRHREWTPAPAPVTPEASPVPTPVAPEWSPAPVPAKPASTSAVLESRPATPAPDVSVPLRRSNRERRAPVRFEAT